MKTVMKAIKQGKWQRNAMNNTQFLICQSKAGGGSSLVSKKSPDNPFGLSITPASIQWPFRHSVGEIYSITLLYRYYKLKQYHAVMLHGFYNTKSVRLFAPKELNHENANILAPIDKEWEGYFIG